MYIPSQVGAQAVVLEQYGVDAIPYMYIGVAAVNIIVIPIFEFISNRCALMFIFNFLIS